jgi:RNA polymerase sigma factor (sigma-70 family)
LLDGGRGVSQAEILQAPDAVVREAGPELAKLFECHARLVLGICRALLRDGYEAEDAAQQTFLSAYRSLLAGTYPRDGAAWLATIARNECRARIRKRMATPIITRADDTVAPVARDVADVANQRAQLRELQAAIADLPQRQREAVLLRDFHGLSYHELASELRTSSPAVESLLIRARRTISRRVRDATECALTFPATLREQLERAIPHFEVAQATVGAGGGIAGMGMVGKVLALPLAAKVTAATVGVMAVGVGVGVEQQRSRTPAPVRAVAVEQTASAAATRSRPGLDGALLFDRPAAQVSGAIADPSALDMDSSPLPGAAGPAGVLAESAVQPEGDSTAAGPSGETPVSAPTSGSAPETSSPVEPGPPEAGAAAPTSPGDGSDEATSTVGSSGSGAASTTPKDGPGGSDASGVDPDAPSDPGLPTSKSDSGGTPSDEEDAAPTTGDDPEREVDDSSSAADRSPSGSEGAGSESEDVSSEPDSPGSGSGSSEEGPDASGDSPPASGGAPADPAGDRGDEASDDSDPVRGAETSVDPEPDGADDSADAPRPLVGLEVLPALAT